MALNLSHPNPPQYPLYDPQKELCTFQAGEAARRESRAFLEAEEDCHLRRCAAGYEKIMNVRIGGENDVQ